MEHIGEYVQNEAITLHLGAEQVQFVPEISNEAPRWTLVGAGPLFHGQIAGGKMEQEESDGSFQARQIVGDWQPGTYLLTMSWMNASGDQRIERLLTIGSLQKKEEVREKLEAESLAHFLQQGVRPEYMPMVSEALPYQATVEGDEIVIRLNTDLSPNHAYLVYLPDALTQPEQGTSDYLVYSFDSLARPIYVGSGEVRRELGLFGKGMEESSILSRVREAGLKAHQMKRLDANAQDAQFEMMEQDDEFYYPLTRFVLYEALLQLSDALIAGWLMGDGMDEGMMESVKRYQIADLTVETGGTGNSEVISTALRMLDKKKQTWQDALTYWKDALMGYSARGYAKAKTINFRTIGGEAPSRDV